MTAENVQNGVSGLKPWREILVNLDRLYKIDGLYSGAAGCTHTLAGSVRCTRSPRITAREAIRTHARKVNQNINLQHRLLVPGDLAFSSSFP